MVYETMKSVRGDRKYGFSELSNFFLDKKNICGIFHNALIYQILNSILAKNFPSTRGEKMGKIVRLNEPPDMKSKGGEFDSRYKNFKKGR